MSNSSVGAYRNVFDDQNEFKKLNDLILGAIQEFSDYRQGNLTYGEIMFVMECILDSLRNSSERDAKNTQIFKGTGEALTFTSLAHMVNRSVEIMVKKNLLTAADEKYILYGE